MSVGKVIPRVLQCSLERDAPPCPPPLIAYSIQENRPCTPPGHHSNANPAGQDTGESAVSFCERDSSPYTLCLPCDGEEEVKMPSHSMTLAANERDRTRESEPCTLPGKHSRADSIDGGVGELASRT